MGVVIPLEKDRKGSESAVDTLTALVESDLKRTNEVILDRMRSGVPMIPELAIAFLAVVKIGGVLLPLFSGYGHGAVATRLADANAKALITADGMWRRGQAIAMKPVADEALRQAPTVEQVIVVERVRGLDVP